jgi:cytochrome c oxidase assembly protein subunit 15
MRLRTALFGVLLFLQSALVLTGGAVRLTGSGLGCPTWPECTPGSYTPVPYQAEGQLHAWIEFGNRLLTFVLLLAAVIVFINVGWFQRILTIVLNSRRVQTILKFIPNGARALKPIAKILNALESRFSSRKDLQFLALGQVLGIFGQGILGGITVLTDLHPLTVAGHLLLSMFLIAGATSLYSRRHEPHIKVSAPTKTVSLLSQTHIVISFIVLILGTIVTGSGPHAGDEKAQRFGFDIRTVAILHADAVIFLMGLTIALLVAASVTQSTKKAIYIFFGISLAQGGVGYAQYLTGIPELLVAIHLAGATIFWIAAWRIRLSVVRTSQQERDQK